MAAKRGSANFGELNLLPIMNMVCLLIPFLLMCAQFIKIGVIMVETPRLSRVQSSQDENKKEALNLTLVMTDKGFYIKSRHGSECPEGVSEDARLCFAKKEGKFTDKVMKDLQLHLWFLFAGKYKSAENYSSPEERFALTIIPEPTVKYEDLVRTMDMVREIPTDAKNPPVKTNPGYNGCKMMFDKKTQAFAFGTTGGVSVKDQACMYYRITLALGSS